MSENTPNFFDKNDGYQTINKIWQTGWAEGNKVGYHDGFRAGASNLNYWWIIPIILFSVTLGALLMAFYVDLWRA